MLTRTLLLFITLNTISTYNCFGMELKDAASENNPNDTVIALNKGLLTKIPGKITKQITTKKNRFYNEETTTETYTKEDYLRTLLLYETSLMQTHPYHTNATFKDARESFKPYIIKATIQKPNIHITLLGQLERYYYPGHSEAVEVIREKQALYWTYDQGVIIYSMEEQPDPSIVEHIKSLLDSGNSSITITV